MSNSTGFYPSVRVDSAGEGVVSQAGGLVLARTVHVSGLGAGLSEALGPWRKPFARHDPGKILTDVALSLATGGDCVSDVDRLRSQPQVYGMVASDPTISRLIKTLSTAGPGKALTAINTARAAARAYVWAAAGDDSPLHGVTGKSPLIVDLDATLIASLIRRRRTPGRRGRKASGSTRWPRSSTTGPPGRGNLWPCYCARVTPGRTPPPTTSAWSGTR